MAEKHPNTLGLSHFCGLSLRDKFQLPRLCISCISMVEEKKKESAVLEATLAQLKSSCVEFELELG